MDYLKRANAEIMIITQVETAITVENIDDILTVDDLDGVFIGPMDLAISMGHFGDAGQAEVQEAIASVEQKTLAAGKILGSIAGTWEQAKAKYDRGYQMLMVMADGTTVAKAAAEKIAQFHEAFPDSTS
jgi:2-dehydro-3-deoxyglucarate aldolase/4-hydroxy-2-oxoheptanedioate aldolase